jgi:glycosyltransferase involved in cell wall biosynthesis
MPAAAVLAATLDFVHFPYQNMERVDIPSIFTPWDFQHEHHPEFFSTASLLRRRSLYPAACREASAIVAGTLGVRDDICQFTGQPIEKVFLMPWGTPTEYVTARPTKELVCKVAEELRLPKEFALYPAQTFPHKNHLRLLQSLARLRDQRGLIVHLVCTGAKNDHFDEIQHEVLRLKLQDQVRFVGYVEDTYLQALYKLATFVVFPSLFEGWGFPPLEALSNGVPLACSRIQPISEHVGDAALLFDPTSVESIAEAVGTLASNRELRAQLSRRGIESREQHSWYACARSHRALYRFLGGAPLTDSDRALLKSAQPNVPSIEERLNAVQHRDAIRERK